MLYFFKLFFKYLICCFIYFANKIFSQFHDNLANLFITGQILFILAITTALLYQYFFF